jgi:hypothetical protein
MDVCHRFWRFTWVYIGGQLRRKLLKWEKQKGKYRDEKMHEKGRGPYGLKPFGILCLEVSGFGRVSVTTRWYFFLNRTFAKMNFVETRLGAAHRTLGRAPITRGRVPITRGRVPITRGRAPITRDRDFPKLSKRCSAPPSFAASERRCAAPSKNNLIICYYQEYAALRLNFDFA